MKSFFKIVLASIVGIILSFVVFFLLLVVIGISTESEVSVKENSVLHISLSSPIYDRVSNNPLEGFSPLSLNLEEAMGLNTILKSIEKAKEDPKIKGIFLTTPNPNGGVATITEIRNALLDFKSSKKFIISYAEWYNQTGYYLSSVADTIYLNPMGSSLFQGLTAKIMFFKRTLEKLGIEAQIIRHGKFKSAIEPLVNEKMSVENRLQTTTFLNSIWNNIVEPISKSRNISIEKLNHIADQLLCRNSQTALEFGLVDKITYYDEVLIDLRLNLNLDKDEKISFITLDKYNTVANAKNKYVKDKIAIIYAQGDIVSGEGSEYQIGSDRIAKAIYEARIDDKIKAIVLRVNSPGGSALASDIIWREVSLAKEKKPIITSMGDVAASGGYYIACATDTIIASPTTITGSIGVFGVLLNNQNLYEEKLGFNFDYVTTNKMSDFAPDNRPLTKNEKRIIQIGIEEIYDDFISKVANGRNLSKKQVDAIGQGRVWSGENAKEIGLIDLFGGMDYSIEIAAKMADLEEYRLVEYPEQKNLFDQILTDINLSIKDKILIDNLGQPYKQYHALENMLNTSGVIMRLSSDIIIN